jgi:hypothetical protein
MIVGAVLCGSLMTALTLQKTLLELLLRAIRPRPIGTVETDETGSGSATVVRR